MATILVEQEIDLKEIIVKTLQRYGGGVRTLRHIERLIKSEYGGSLDYSPRAFLIAFEHLIHDGLRMDDTFYRLRIKICPHFLGRHEVRFWLLKTFSPDKDRSPESVSIPISPSLQETKIDHEKYSISADS